MGGGSYSSSWAHSYNTTNYPSYRYKAEYSSRTNNSDYQKEQNTSLLQNLVTQYINTNIYKNRNSFSLNSHHEINSFFKLVESILANFKNINAGQTKLLSNKLENLKVQYQKYRINSVNSLYSDINKDIILTLYDNDLNLKVELSRFIDWLDNTLQIYDLLPESMNKESEDARE